MKLITRVDRYNRVKWWEGRIYYDPQTNENVVTLWGLNYILAFVRNFHHAVQAGDPWASRTLLLDRLTHLRKENERLDREHRIARAKYLVLSHAVGVRSGSESVSPRTDDDG